MTAIDLKLPLQFMGEGCSWIPRDLKLSHSLLVLDRFIDSRLWWLYVEQLAKCHVFQLNEVEVRTATLSSTLYLCKALLSLLPFVHFLYLCSLILYIGLLSLFHILEPLLQSVACLLHILEPQLQVLFVLPWLNLDVLYLPPLSPGVCVRQQLVIHRAIHDHERLVQQRASIHRYAKRVDHSHLVL